MPASLSRRFGAGGGLGMKVKVRSAKMVTTQGITIPRSLWGRALHGFTSSMMVTPTGPRAVPTGGAGVAAPAGHWSFPTAWIFFAMHLLVTWAHDAGQLPRIRAVAVRRAVPAALPFHPGGPPARFPTTQADRRN